MFVARALTSFPIDSPLADGNPNKKRRRMEKVNKIVLIE
jgi:hypothetical protein